MSISRSVSEQLERASWIRRMFEEGARLKARLGADKVFDFTLGNPDIEPPAEVTDLLARIATEHRPQRHAYMPNVGYPEAREAVARRLAQETGLPFTRDHIVMTVGSSGACNVFLRATLDPGDEVIVLVPWFSEYQFYIQNHAGRMVAVDTDEEFLPDLDRIAAAITPRTKAIILNSPNNPTGRVYPPELLRDLDALIRSLNRPVTVISDEPYAPIVFDGRTHPPVAALIERTVIANSWSKTFAIPGERIGYLAISPRLPEATELFNACAFTNRILGFINAPALWQRVIASVAHLTPDVSCYERRRNRMCEALSAIGYEVRKPEGTFYLFPKSPLEDDLAFIRILLEEGVLAVPGTGFGRAGYFRLSLTVPESAMEGSLAAFGRALAKAQRLGPQTA